MPKLGIFPKRTAEQCGSREALIRRDWELRWGQCTADENNVYGARII